MSDTNQEMKQEYNKRQSGKKDRILPIRHFHVFSIGNRAADFYYYYFDLYRYLPGCDEAKCRYEQ